MRWSAASLLWLSLTALLVGPTPALALVGVGLSLAALGLARTVALGRLAEIALTLGVFGLAALLAANLDPSQALIGADTVPRGWAALGIASLLVAVLRLWLATPLGGAPTTLGLGLVSLAIWGAKISGGFYPLAVLGYLLSAACALRAADAARPALRNLDRRHRGLLAAAVASSLSLALLGSALLPPLHGWVVERVMRGLPKRSGFSSFLWLGSMKGMLQSDKIVMRVRGAPTDYLRGIVYVTYAQGAWTRRTAEHVVRPVPREGGPGTTELELVRSGPRYFVPLGALDVSASTGFVMVDDVGIVEPVAGDPAKRIWYTNPPSVSEQVAPTGLAHIPTALVSGSPSNRELSLPWELQRELRQLALGWTQGAKTPHAKLQALTLHLRSEYRYSLDFERRDGVDPILDFLLRDKSGHCEYFATALALLGRSIGVPTRVVAGFTVSEFSPLGDYYLVRERNAHSWVEGWTGQRWETFDATPRTEILGGGAAVTPWASGLFDLAASSWSRFMDWLLERELSEVIGALTAAVALLLLVRLLRLRRAARAKSAQGSNAGPPPLPGWLDLEQTLKGRGLQRLPTETPNAWAQRVSGALPSALGDQLRQLSQAYAALRYGAVGEEEELQAQLSQLGTQLRALAPR